MLRFTFPGEDANLIFDNVNNNGGLTLDPETGVVTGYSDVKSGLSAGATRMFVYATFDKPVSASGMLPGGGGRTSPATSVRPRRARTAPSPCGSRPR
jgi:hypothetical protein